MNEALFHVDIPLRLTELMYHPRSTGTDGAYDADEFEFIELKNMGDAPIDLAGFRIEGSVEFAFPEEAGVLASDEVVLVVENINAFNQRYPFLGAFIAGEYDGRLANSEDELRLLGPSGEPLLEFGYDDAWHPQTDGEGYSLTISDPNLAPEAWDDAANWTSGATIDGTPGVCDAPRDGGRQVPGDMTQNGNVDLSDAVRLLTFLFLESGARLPCEGTLGAPGNTRLLDGSGDGDVNLSDAIYLLNYLFLGGPRHSEGTECVRLDGCPDACGD